MYLVGEITPLYIKRKFLQVWVRRVSSTKKKLMHLLSWTDLYKMSFKSVQVWTSTFILQVPFWILRLKVFRSGPGSKDYRILCYRGYHDVEICSNFEVDTCIMEKLLLVLKGSRNVFLKCVQYGCIYHCVTTYGVSCVTCDGKSMEPAIYHGDAYIVECVSVHRQKLKRGDIVGVKSMDDPNKYICKRIVAMAGDKVYNDISNERVWVPKGHVWLEGDNKSSSHDSRYYGSVPYGLIFCRLVFRIWSGHNHKVHMSKDR